MQKKLWIVRLISVICFLWSMPCWSANHCVLASATGAGTGASWTDAWTDWNGVTWTPGDTYYVGAGSYTHSAALNQSGTDNTHRIVVKRATIANHGAATGWNDSFDGTVTTTVTGASSYAFNGAGYNYWTIDGNGDASKMVWNGDTYGVYGWRSIGPVVASCTVNGTGTGASVSGVNFSPVESGAITNSILSTATTSGSGAAALIGATGPFSFTGNTVTSTYYGVWFYSSTWTGHTAAPTIVSSNNNISGTLYALYINYNINGMSVISTNDTITGATSSYPGVQIVGSGTGAIGEWYGLDCHGNSGHGWTTNSATITWTSFILTKSATRDWSFYDNGGCGALIIGCDGGTVSHGSAYSNGSDGLDIRTAPNGMTFSNVTTAYNKIDGLSFGYAGNAALAVINPTITQCQSIGNGNDTTSAGDGFTAHDGCTGMKFHSCLSYLNQNSGFAVVNGSSGEILNCTIARNGCRTCINVGVRGGFYTSGTGGWTIENNSITNNYPYEINCSATGYAASTFDYNHYYHNQSDTGIIDTNGWCVDNSTPHDWTWYHTTQGNESHSTNSNANYVFGYNFYPLPGPLTQTGLCGAGNPYSAITYYFDGRQATAADGSGLGGFINKGAFPFVGHGQSWWKGLAMSLGL